MSRIIVVFVFVLVDFTSGEDIPKLNKSIVSDDVVKADRILNDFYAGFNYLTSNVARFALPVMLKINEEVKVSRSCVRGAMRLLADLKQNKGWILKLLDSTGKPSGIFSGKTWLHGDYDQCINIEVKDDKIIKTNRRMNTFYGKFCSVNFGFNSYKFRDALEDIPRNKMYKILKDSLQPFPVSKFIEMFSYMKVAFRVDICIPSTCNREDVENILQWAFRDPYRAKVNFCKVKNQKITLSTIQIICIIAISIFIPWVIIGTILETLCKFNIINASCNKGDYLHSFVAVSLRTSTQKLFSTDFNQKTRFFCGMKCLVNCLSVLVHIVFYSGFIYSILVNGEFDIVNLLTVEQSAVALSLSCGAKAWEIF
ncbi:nose resistant to fluoxetine protein 6-like [Centruroides vittatus]|uniref:nose resistant to fluoxetine protein 6-like n=1 Tax=Centruroides vittatus TaxID=120091 RepID=UPI00350F1DF0